ncbi:MAG: glycosyltransferase family 4 protein [Acidobacteriota bacterium]
MPQSDSKDQRVWIVSELYHPELTSTGYFLTGIAEGLAVDYDVSVLCGQPSYLARGTTAPRSEIRNGVHVRRCPATTLDKNKLVFKIVNLITITLSIFLSALFRFRAGDIVIAVTNPPLLPYAILLACRMRGARLVLLVHDVYPELLIRLNIVIARSAPVRLLDWASRWLYNGADRIVVLGRDMRELVVQKLRGAEDRVVIAANWGDTEANYPCERAQSRLLTELNLKGCFVAQYCGNIGRTHGIGDIVEAAKLMVSDPEFHFLVIGWGARKQWIIEQKQVHSLDNLTVVDPLEQSDLCDGLNACDVSIIAFSRGMSGISVPSRMYNVLAAGKPLLAVTDDDSEMAAVVTEEEIGWVIPPGRPSLLVNALREAKADEKQLQSMGKRARQAAEAKYTRSHILKLYRDLIEGMLAK